MLSEWNDCLHNDIMFLKRDIIDKLLENGISKFILIGENILNFHYSDDSYYEEWNYDNSDGWIALLGLRRHIVDEFGKINLLQYLHAEEALNDISWRTYNPLQLFRVVEKIFARQPNQPR